MHRPGADPLDMKAEDFLCDFCGAHWSDSRPMVEGHHGSLVCGACLSAGYALLVHAGSDDRVPGARCTMCLEEREEPMWRSPLREESLICRRCVDLAARQLERDRSSGWRRP